VPDGGEPGVGMRALGGDTLERVGALQSIDGELA